MKYSQAYVDDLIKTNEELIYKLISLRKENAELKKAVDVGVRVCDT